VRTLDAGAPQVAYLTWMEGQNPGRRVDRISKRTRSRRQAMLHGIDVDVPCRRSEKQNIGIE
jgi:hypothetical protein